MRASRTLVGLGLLLFGALPTGGLHAQQFSRVVTGPGQVLDSATIVIRNGLIAAHADLGMDTVPPGGDVGPTHWNPQVPQVPVKLHPEPEVDAHARHLSEAQRRIGRDAALLADKHAIQLPC